MALLLDGHLVRNAQGGPRCRVVETECGEVIEDCTLRPMPEVQAPYAEATCRECKSVRAHMDELFASMRGDS